MLAADAGRFDMIVLILGLLLFFATHSVRMLAPGLRDAQIAANEGRWKGLYSLASLIGFGLIVWGYMLYRPEAGPLYVPPEWGRHVTFALVWLGLVSLTAAYQPVGRIKSTLQHPFLVGVILWSLGHLFANGDAAGVLVFGAFLVYSVGNLVAELRRGEAKPVFAGYRGDLIAVVAGTLAYAALLFWLHGWLFGVSPLT
jgi:uncharacterized membrane protein